MNCKIDTLDILKLLLKSKDIHFSDIIQNRDLN